MKTALVILPAGVILDHDSQQELQLNHDLGELYFMWLVSGATAGQARDVAVDYLDHNPDDYAVLHSGWGRFHKLTHVHTHLIAYTPEGYQRTGEWMAKEKVKYSEIVFHE